MYRQSHIWAQASILAVSGILQMKVSYTVTLILPSGRLSSMIGEGTVGRSSEKLANELLGALALITGVGIIPDTL